MAHPNGEMVQDFRKAVAQLVPLTPKAIRDEAMRLADDLEQNESSTVEQIRQALVYVGKKEYPYRKAYQELCAGDEEARLQELVLGKLDESLKAKMEPVVKYGVHILDFVKSSQFESELSDDERSQVDREITAAHDVLDRQCDERAAARRGTYDELVARWTATQTHIQQTIEVLRGMADRDPEYHDDILARVEQFENGWSMVEVDPTVEDVQKEITYWTGVLSEDEEDGTAE